jgi:SAM-dependent methyltransferase
MAATGDDARPRAPHPRDTIEEVAMAAPVDERDALAGWQLERASAEAYERYGVPAWSRALAQGLLRIAAPGPGERLLDVACGTGIVARLAAEAVGEAGSVCGVDLNEAMLAVARDAGWGVRPPIDWRQGDAAALPVDDESADVVTCQQALQFLPDREAALRELRRVLVPGGRVAVSVLRPIRHNPGWEALAVLLERHTGSSALRAPFPELDAAELRELATSAGFRRVRVQIVVATAHYPSPEHVIRWEAALAPPGGPQLDLAGETGTALVRDYARAIGAYVDDDGVRFPQETWVVTGRR